MKTIKTNADFGEVLKALRRGDTASRAGWNGKTQFISLGYNIVYSDVSMNGQSYLAKHEDIGSKAIVFHGTRGDQVGWLASQSDMLAEDWEIHSSIESKED